MFAFQGGKPIGSGTYGCVFYPALKCKSNSRDIKTKKRKKSRYPMVSKLMTERNLLSEYKEIDVIKKALQHLPFFKKYFLLENVSYCQPKKLTKNDFVDFDKKCKSSKFNKDTINDNINKYFILNMPYGGDTVKEFINSLSSNASFIDLNNHMIDLIQNAVIPMNENHVYHSDIKDKNLLVATSANGTKFENLKIIDWGLATVSSSFEKIPSRWENRPLQFNAPLSCVLFFPDFLDQFNDMFVKKNGYLTDDDYGKILTNFLDFLLKDAPGHFGVINDFLKDLFSGENFSSSTTTRDVIINYLREILKRFSHMDTGGFDFETYIDKVYRHILDIHGVLTCYWPVIELLASTYSSLQGTDLKMFQFFKSFMFKYLFNPRVKPYDMKSLEKDMKYINKFFEADDKNLRGSPLTSSLHTHVSSTNANTPTNVDASIASKLSNI